MPAFADRVERVLRDYLLTQMPPDASAALATASLRDLVTAYATWKGRYIPARPRRGHVSPELAASSKAREHKASLDVIVEEIETGADLTPRLSKRVLVAHETPADPTASLSRREDRDLMLADWGIHHLHLATTMGSDGFVNRGEDLLFAAFLPDDAYLIGIYGHLTDWARKEILEIVVRNWPASGLVLETGAIGLTDEHSDEDRRVLRNLGISSPIIVVDGKVWASAALGHSADGAPMRTGQIAMAVVWAIEQWRERPEELLAEAARAVDEVAGRPVAGAWEPVVYDECIGLQREDVFHAIARLS